MARKKRYAMRASTRRGAARTRSSRPAGSVHESRRPAPGESPSGDGDVSTLPSFPVIGIGASAGGLEACSQVFAELPADLNAALIVVMHLDPHHASVLPDLLGANSKLSVVHVTDGMPIEPNRAFVIPPNSRLGIVEGKLRLMPRPADRSQFKPVDFFFRTLAAYAQDRAIGIVLSGTDADGAVGLRDIKGIGGITIAQDPNTAKYDGMPRAAIQTGMVDLVLQPHEVARELVHIARHPYVAPVQFAKTGKNPGEADEQLQKIFLMLREATGVDFSHYKLATIRRRLERRMVLHKTDSVDHYIKFLHRDPSEVRALYQDLLIHVTRFFRDPESFELLAGKVFPQLVSKRGGSQAIRIWVPGCSTGEEAYSVAIAILEFLGEQSAVVPIQIFATDVSETAVEQARSGTYPESIAADVSPERLTRFFTKSGATYRISKTVRDMCVFARQDLTRDPPFSKLDLILCRNVLIYLSPALQRRLMNVFHYALRHNGFLMLGSAETIGPSIDLFAVSDRRHRLYTKRGSAGRADLHFPPVDYRHDRADAGRKLTVDLRTAGNVQNEANRLVIARYAPAGVIINSDLQIIQFRGQTGSYLEPAPGEASLNLLKMAREGLLHAVRTAVHEARHRNQSVRKERVRVTYNGSVSDVNLEVIPLAAAREGRHFLVLFEPASPAPIRGAGRRPLKNKQAAPTEAEHVRRLREELAASREYLQSIIQDLEAANEELQSANEEILSADEELQSTNEELDTAKEELQSTNEELNTVNEELQARNEDLSQANNDLVNLLGSVQIAIVMVARDLRIRRFTPMAEKILNLIPTDVGRPIGALKPNIDCPDLEKLIVEAIESVSTKERQVREHNGKPYWLRIRPYKSVDNRIDGAVLALVEADAEKSGDSADQP